MQTFQRLAALSGFPLCEEIPYTGNDVPTALCMANAWLRYLVAFAAAIEAGDEEAATKACEIYQIEAEKCLSNP